MAASEPAVNYGTCHVCGWHGPLGTFYFVGEQDNWPVCQCADSFRCAQRQLRAATDDK